MIKMIKYKPGTHTKDNPFKWEGTYEEFLNIPHHDSLNVTLNDPNSFYTEDYIKYNCVDCGKETIVKIGAVFTFHREVLKGKKLKCQDDFLCGWCKTSRRSMELYGQPNINITRDYVISARKRKAEEKQLKIQKKEEKLKKEHNKDYSTFRYTRDNPYHWTGSYEELINTTVNSNPSINNMEYVSYYCKDCGKLVIQKLETIKSYAYKCKRENRILSQGLYCQRCKEKRSNLERFGNESYHGSNEGKERIFGEKGSFWNGENRIKYQEAPIFLDDWEDYIGKTFSDKQIFEFQCYDCNEIVTMSRWGLNGRLKFISEEGRDHLYCHSCSIRHTTRPNYYESTEPYLIKNPEDLYSKDFWRDQNGIFICEECGKEEIKRINVLKENYEVSGKLLCASCMLSNNQIEAFRNKIIGTSKEPLTSKEKLEEFFNQYPKKSLRFYLDKLNKDFKAGEHIYRGTLIKYAEKYGLRDYLNHCGVSFEEGSVEEILLDFLDESDIVRRSQKIIPPLELDFYIPSKNIAIEFNGNYWHSDEYLNQTRKVSDQYENYGKIYHQNKSLKCKEKGIYLVHIFEFEWNDRTSYINRENIIDYIEKLINNNEEDILNKSIEIKEISNEETLFFLEENSLLTDHKIGFLNLGLFVNGNLSSILSIEDNQIVNFEYTISSSTSFKYLFEYYINNYNIDNITFNYNLNYPIKLNLEELGFKLKEITEPTYKITNNNSVFTPEEFKLREDLQDKKHYYKIYSAGNLIYSYNKSKENQKKNERH